MFFEILGVVEALEPPAALLFFGGAAFAAGTAALQLPGFVQRRWVSARLHDREARRAWAGDRRARLQARRCVIAWTRRDRGFRADSALARAYARSARAGGRRW